jgi:hypothetical protein
MRNEIRKDIVAPSFRRSLPEGWESTNPETPTKKPRDERGFFVDRVGSFLLTYETARAAKS